MNSETDTFFETLQIAIVSARAVRSNILDRKKVFLSSIFGAVSRKPRDEAVFFYAQRPIDCYLFQLMKGQHKAVIALAGIYDFLSTKRKLNVKLKINK